MDRTNRVFSLQSIVLIALAGAFLSFPLTGRAQQSTSTTSAQTGITTIRTYTNLVIVDVVVNDSKGNPVHGLKASDFTLLENNKMQSIRHFEEHSQVPATDIKYEGEPKMPDGLFTNKIAVPVNGPVNVLLLDYLNTPLIYQPQARKQLQDYLDKAPPGTRIAIFALTTRLVMLQGFTSDPAVLKNVMIKKATPYASNLLSDPINGGTITDTALSDSFANDPTAVDGMLTQDDMAAISRFEDMATSFQQDLIAKYTLGAFDSLARYLVGMPGRKNVIWFSGGFPLDVQPNVNEEGVETDSQLSVVRNDEEVRKTDNLLTRAQVAVYPVDARGLMTNPAYGASADGFNNAPPSTDIAGAQSFLTTTAAQHETMEAMAEDTGGKAYYNTNGLTAAVQSAIANGSNYYTLTYSPSNTQFDERFRAIKVKVDQSGVKLNYRDGYYAMDPNDKNKAHAAQAAVMSTQPNAMVSAMIHGGPDPAEILFKVRIRPSDAPPADTPLKTNRTNPDPKVKVEGPYKYYGVDLVPDPKSVSCNQEESGTRHCAFEVWTYVYDRDGQLLVTTGNKIFTKLTSAEYAQMQTGRMAFHQEISVPVKGVHYLRTAIHDMNSDRVGAVEVPVAAVAKLEPLKPLPAVPAAAASTFTANGDAATTPATDAAAATQGTGAATGTTAPATPAVSVPVTGTVTGPPKPDNPNPTLRRRTDPTNASPAPANPPTAPANPPTTPN